MAALEEPATNRINVRLRRKITREARCHCTCGWEEDAGLGQLTEALTMNAGIQHARNHNNQAHQGKFRIFAIKEREIK